MFKIAAVFPNSVKNFTTKHNKIEDIEASHVNDLQNEVTAIENNIGNNAHIWAPNFLGVNQNYGNLRNRLRIIQNGDHLPVVRLKRDTVPIKNNVDTYVSFNRQNDPYGHYNLSDITLKSNGWWIFMISGWWEHHDVGRRMLTLEQNGNQIMRSVDVNIDETGELETMQHLMWQGLAGIGDRFRVKVSQKSGTTLDLTSVRIHAAMLRFYDPALF